MLDMQEAKDVIKSYFPDSTIRVGIEHKDKYFFVVYVDDSPESFYDPFYWVDKKTGECSDFSITNGPYAEGMFELFNAEIAKKEGLANE